MVNFEIRWKNYIKYALNEYPYIYSESFLKSFSRKFFCLSFILNQEMIVFDAHN